MRLKMCKICLLGKGKSKSQQPQRDYVKIQKMLDKHVSKSITRKAIKAIFPPSMYQKYGREKSSASRSKKNRNTSSKGKRTTVKAPLPPVREYRTAGQAQRSKTLRDMQNIDNLKRKSTSKSAKRTLSTSGHNNHSGSRKRKSNSRGRQLSENRARNIPRLTSKSPEKGSVNIAHAQIAKKLYRHNSAHKPSKRPKSGSRSKSKNRKKPMDYQQIREGIHRQLNYDYTGSVKAVDIPLYPKKTQNSTVPMGSRIHGGSMINIVCAKTDPELVKTPESKQVSEGKQLKSESGTGADTTATKRRNPSSSYSHNDTSNAKSEESNCKNRGKLNKSQERVVQDFQHHGIRNITSVLDGEKADDEPRLAKSKPMSFDSNSQSKPQHSEKEYSLKLDSGFDDSDFQSLENKIL